MTPKKIFKSEAQEKSFAEFWACYWRRVGRADAEKAYAKQVLTVKTHEAVMLAVTRQSPEMLARSIETRPHAATWLNGRRWEDEVVVRDTRIPQSPNGSLVARAIASDEEYLIRKTLQDPAATVQEIELCKSWLAEHAECAS